MSKSYFTYRICVKNQHYVEIEKYDLQNQSLGRPSGKFCYQDNAKEVKQLLQIAHDNQLNEKQSRQLGEALFNSLLEPVLRQDLINFYFKYVQEEKQLLRIELDIDEQEMPEIAALPWEFLCFPEDAHQGTVWLATDSNLVFSRRRALWNPAKSIQLGQGEKLRIALAIASPQDLGHVEYQEVQEYLERLAEEQSQYIELLPIVNPATATAIDELLEKKPHIFHFIGHGQFENEEGEKGGQIALVREVLNKANWVSADFFAGLFAHVPRPGIIVLQACEGGMQSESEAFRGVAAKIVSQNIPVVVAMQYEIANATASVFSYEFYRRLAKLEPVDLAAQNGRRKIALETQYKTRDFATPVIFMNVQNGYLFTPAEPVSDNGGKNIAEPIIDSVINDNEDKFVLTRELTGSEKGKLKQALNSAFPNLNELNTLLIESEMFDWKLDDVVNVQQAKMLVLSDLIEYTEGEGSTENLLNLVFKAKPNNLKLKKFRASLVN